MSVPAGQASATTYTIDTIEGTSITSASVSSSGVIDETWGMDVQEGAYVYSHDDGQGGTVSYNQTDLESTSSVPNAISFEFSDLSNTTNTLAITQNITNNTGYDADCS